MIFHFADEGTLWVAKGCVLDNTVAIRPGDDVRHRLEDDSLHRTPLSLPAHSPNVVAN